MSCGGGGSGNAPGTGSGGETIELYVPMIIPIGDGVFDTMTIEFEGDTYDLYVPIRVCGEQP